MAEAFLWGLAAASTLLLGALIAEARPPSKRTLGLVMGFGSGVLLSAVAYELVEEALDTAGDLRSVVWGLFAGTAVFTFDSCTTGSVTFNLTDPVATGTIALQRILPASAACTAANAAR